MEAVRADPQCSPPLVGGASATLGFMESVWKLELAGFLGTFGSFILA